MEGEQIKELVRDRYAAVALGNEACCGSAATPREASCGMGYSDTELTRRGTLPVGVTFVEKPFSPKVLRQRVLDLLSQT